MNRAQTITHSFRYYYIQEKRARYANFINSSVYIILIPKKKQGVVSERNILISSEPAYMPMRTILWLLF